jgi:hypothetical protein
VDVYLRDFHLTPTGGDDVPAELLFTNARVQLEVIAGEPDHEGGRSIEGFYLVATESTTDGEPAPDGIRVRIPAQPETMRLLASSVLDYLEQHQVRGSDLTIASAGEVAQIAHLSRADRRRLERKGR